MRITILCSESNHPVMPRLQAWCERRAAEHTVDLVHCKADAKGGDLLLLISCHEIVGASDRARYKKALVIHASDLPQGRGWSPHVWTVINGGKELVVTLFEADDTVDSGPIWHKIRTPLSGHELYDEINSMVFRAEIALMDFAVENFNRIKPRVQPSAGTSYYPRRTPDDSRLDPDKTLREQFALLRVSDPGRYPAFFDLDGHRYEIVLRKIN